MEIAEENSSKENTEAVQQKSNDGDTPSPPLPQEPAKKSKKDDKNVEQFIKSLNSLPTQEEKLNLVCKKYVASVEDNKKMQFYVKQSDRRYTQLLKEKEHLQHEFNKIILVKSKLENLCRELQKQNKAIKDEYLQKMREEEERRKETQVKFQSTLAEITTLLQQNNEKNTKLRDDNINMGEKIKTIVQEHKLREQQVEKLTKQMELEQQLSDAKLQKAYLEYQAGRERMVVEIEGVKMIVDQYRAKILELQQNEAALKGQLAIYTDKYDEFQNALVKSNQVFTGFKEQMEMMSKKIKTLEKETLSWKKRWETSQTALLDMCSERQASEERNVATARQLQQMQGLCRTLQGERTVLLATLKENNIERPPLPTPPPAPAAPTPPPATASDTKVDAMVANCAQLRQSLTHLQSQLSVLTTNKTNEEPPKHEKEKSKKNKSKKNKQNAKAEKEKVDSDSANSSETQNFVNPDINKIDDKSMENLIEAINIANMSLNNLEINTNDINKVVEEGASQPEARAVVTETPEVTNDEKCNQVATEPEDVPAKQLESPVHEETK